MNYFFLGEAAAKKEEQIFALRDKLLPEGDSRQFDYEVLYSEKLDPKILKSRLISLPTIAKRRLIILRGVEDLAASNRELLLEFLAGKPDHVDLILDSDELKPQDAFVAKLKNHFKIVDLGRAPDLSVFDMTNALDRHRPADAMQLLNDLLAGGQHPLQIMGGLVWFWRQKKGRLPTEKFRRGLEALQEADLNIKRSRLSPEFAVEKLVTELGMILG